MAIVAVFRNISLGAMRRDPMLANLDDLERDLTEARTVPETVDIAMGLIGRAGFDALIYDFSPVATTPDGALITPSHLSYRNVPSDMRDLWCKKGYHQRDPVQQLALGRALPFPWSYRSGDDATDLCRHLSREHAAVSAYLHDAGLTCGVTVPLHRANGGFATFTAICHDAPVTFAKDCREVLLEIGLIGQMMHEHAYRRLSPSELHSAAVNLTDRERECLRLSAEGLTAKEIADRIGRSVPTATLHLKSATRKLGARNRLHAVTLAIHYRLLDL